MSLKITAKGMYALGVGGQNFSNHVQEREGIEKASKVLEADPSLAVTLTPPVVHIESDDASLAIESTEPVLSDGGVDLFDFIGDALPPTELEIVPGAATPDDVARHAAIRSRTRLWPWRIVFAGKLIGFAWRGHTWRWDLRNVGEIVWRGS